MGTRKRTQEATSQIANVRHILSLSGGKDSTALAIYMRDRVANMEYVFCDTKKELPETYTYLEKIEAYLGKKIVRLCDDRGFDHWLQIKRDYLPSSRMRWCTEYLKIKPFEKYVGDDEVMMYVGIRADENRAAYISTKPNIHAVHPFVEDNITLDDVHRILEESGIGLPEYYNWRTRSGCYFCFFQRRSEWVGLRENHPELYELAKTYEKLDPETGVRYTWNQRESLDELELPSRIEEIKRKQEAALGAKSNRYPNMPLVEVFSEVLDDESDDTPCFFCQS
jgi:3'-phosphoadenosine 5'-phosphosulfate sulfotransferase (PAPS reductase)/FAD synthetase